MLINGRKFAKSIYNDLKHKINTEHIITPGLAIIIVGDNKCQMYVRMLKKKSKILNISFVVKKLSNNISQKEIIDEIIKLNLNNNIHGIIIQLPLPSHLDEFKVLNHISEKKDIDGVHQTNVYNLVSNRKPKFYPCTPEACITLLEKSNIQIDGKHVVILGRSRIVGMPLSLMLLHMNATVTICHSHTKNTKNIVRMADILITACGKAKYVKKDWLNKDVVIIDVGVNVVNEDNKYTVCGDVDFQNVRETVRAITPVPGGVGPMTIAMVMKHVVESAYSAV